MALDEPNDADEVHQEQGFSVVIEKDLLDKLGGVSIDFEQSRWFGSGFRVTATRNASGACC